MSKKIAVITIHGMGETKPNYWTGLEKELESRLGRDAWHQVSFQPIFYQSIIQPNQYRVWNNMPLEKLDAHKLRKFMLFSFSDAACLEHNAHESDSPYIEAQQKILDAVTDALNEVESARSPVVLFAHSLGCQVLSNYIWDSDRDQGIWPQLATTGLTPDDVRFLKLKTKRYLFTTGCNIPLFVSGFKNVQAIQKTPASFEWFNYYDEDDVLGWPLKPLSASYRRVVAEDTQMNAGGWLTGWNPVSHTQYWSDKDFLEPVTRKVRRLLG